MQPSGPLLDQPNLVYEIVADLVDHGFAENDLLWSENCSEPTSAEQFAHEAIFVICNSGMHNRVARTIFAKIRLALKHDFSASTVFGHVGKSAAIDQIWSDRDNLFKGYIEAVDKVAFCRSLPWIGGITSYHLAKNFGVQVAKPDVHLQRLAAKHGTDAQTLCEIIAERTGFKPASVDLILWRACAERIVDSKSGIMRNRIPPAPSTPSPPYQVELFEPVQQELF